MALWPSLRLVFVSYVVGAAAILAPTVTSAGGPTLVVPPDPPAGTAPLAFDAPAGAAPVTFERSVADGTTRTLLGIDDDPSDGFAVAWDTADFAGPAILRATGESGEHDSLRVEVDNALPGLKVTTRYSRFSPNDDGRRDDVTLRAIVGEAGTLSAVVMRPSGSVVTELLRGEPVEAGRTLIVWDGLRPQNRERSVADGPFTVRVVLTDAAGNHTALEKEVVVDTRAPGLSWRQLRPSVTSSGPLKLRYRTADPDSELVVTIRLVDQYGRRVRVLSKERTSPGAVRMKLNADLGRVLPGGYRLELEARDLAGNVTSRSKPLRIDGATTSKVIRRLPGAGRRVALAFDDCNETAAWSRILNVLADYGEQASFFCLGALVSSRTSVARRTVVDGHTIGAHGWDHSSLPTVGYAGALSRLRSERDRWWALARVTPTPFFRPPFGDFDASTLAAAGDAGYRWTVMWDVDPSDYLRPAPSVTASRVLNAVRPGSIVVLHAIANTASALPAILDGLRARNLKQVSLHEMFRAAGLANARR